VQFAAAGVEFAKGTYVGTTDRGFGVAVSYWYMLLFPSILPFHTCLRLVKKCLAGLYQLSRTLDTNHRFL
jgi:hypothetical protein